MARGAVSARKKGDNYQGLFFWWVAAQLFIDRTLVERVIIEYDDAGGVDDIAVFYSAPGRHAGISYIRADFYQIKFHVTHEKSYSAQRLITPANRAKSSLLQRFAEGYRKLSEKGYSEFRLNLVSNQSWSESCPLRSCLDDGGALREQFFEASEGTKIGKERTAWKSHLGLSDEQFLGFAQKLRFGTGFWGRQNLEDVVNDRLTAAGLQPSLANHQSCRYQSLAEQFLMGGPYEFDRDILERICTNEGLFVSDRPKVVKRFRLGVRSFLRKATDMEEMSDDFVCVARYFNDRFPINENGWTKAAADVRNYLANDMMVRDPIEIALECHGSFALLAGYELSFNSGHQVYPVQKSRDGASVWEPDAAEDEGPDEAWKMSVPYIGNGDGILVVALSVTHDISDDVLAYVSKTSSPAARKVVHLTLNKSASYKGVLGLAHATRMAEQLVEKLKELRLHRTEDVHLFFSAPNGFMFILGQFRANLGRLLLHEYDLELGRDGSYESSISIPYIGTE